MKNKSLIINFISFQLLWIASVQAIWWLAAFALVIFLAIHGLFVVKEKTEWVHAFIFLCLGLVIESAIATQGIVSYANSLDITVSGVELRIAPLWLLCLWIGLSTSFYHSLSWLSNRPKLAAALVATSLPFNYYIGAKLSNSVFPGSVIISLSIIAVVWLALFPLGFTLINKLRSSTYFGDSRA